MNNTQQKSSKRLRVLVKLEEHDSMQPTVQVKFEEHDSMQPTIQVKLEEHDSIVKTEISSEPQNVNGSEPVVNSEGPNIKSEQTETEYTDIKIEESIKLEDVTGFLHQIQPYNRARALHAWDEFKNAREKTFTQRIQSINQSRREYVLRSYLIDPDLETYADESTGEEVRARSAARRDASRESYGRLYDAEERADGRYTRAKYLACEQLYDYLSTECTDIDFSVLMKLFDENKSLALTASDLEKKYRIMVLHATVEMHFRRSLPHLKRFKEIIKMYEDEQDHDKAIERLKLNFPHDIIQQFRRVYLDPSQESTL